MIKSIRSFSIILIIIVLFVSCNSNSEQTLEDLIPNSTWFTTSTEESNAYSKIEFGDTDYLSTFHEFPCGSEEEIRTVGTYEIINDSKLIMAAENTEPDTVQVLSYAETEITIKKEEGRGNNEMVLVPNCEEL